MMTVPEVARYLRLKERKIHDLLARKRIPWGDYFEPPFQTLLKFTRTPEFAEKARSPGGYDIGALGEVLYNSP